MQKYDVTIGILLCCFFLRARGCHASRTQNAYHCVEDEIALSQLDADMGVMPAAKHALMTLL